MRADFASCEFFTPETYESDSCFEQKQLSEQALSMEREFLSALAKGADALDRAVVRYGTAAIRRAVSTKDLSMWTDYFLALGALGTVAKSSQAYAEKLFFYVCGGRDEETELFIKENSFLMKARIKGVTVWGFKPDCGKALRRAQQFVANYGRTMFTLDIKTPKKEVTPTEALAKKAFDFMEKYSARTKKTGAETAFAEKAREQLQAAGINVEEFLAAARVLALADAKFLAVREAAE